MEIIVSFTSLIVLSLFYYNILVKKCVQMSRIAFRESLENMATNGIKQRETNKNELSFTRNLVDSNKNIEINADKLGALNGVATGIYKSMKMALR